MEARVETPGFLSPHNPTQIIFSHPKIFYSNVTRNITLRCHMSKEAFDLDTASREVLVARLLENEALLDSMRGKARERQKRHRNRRKAVFGRSVVLPVAEDVENYFDE